MLPSYSGLQGILAKKGDKIGQRWAALIFEEYPAETAQFLKNKKDQFDNPVGFAVNEMSSNVLRAMAEHAEPDEIARRMAAFIKIRSVQGFTPPSQALMFIYKLKAVMMDEMAEEAAAAGLSAEMGALEFAVEMAMLKAFDIFMDCRCKIFEIKEEEMKRNMHMLLRQAGMVCVPEERPASD